MFFQKLSEFSENVSEFSENVSEFSENYKRAIDIIFGWGRGKGRNIYRNKRNKGKIA